MEVNTPYVRHAPGEEPFGIRNNEYSTDLKEFKDRNPVLDFTIRPAQLRKMAFEDRLEEEATCG